jgi:phosphoglycolate phosphatase
VPTLAFQTGEGRVFLRAGFRWDAADVYLFDIDGTLLNSRDSVHYMAFRSAMRYVLGLDATIDHVPVHGNTDPGILRAVLRKEGMSDTAIDACMPNLLAQICSEVDRNRDQLCPELCPSILELLSSLRSQDKLLGVASGNLGPLGRLKLEKAGLTGWFSFGAFSHPLELRSEIFLDGIAQARSLRGSGAQVFVIGDTPADIAAAACAGVPVIALATGIYDFQSLLRNGPDGCFGSATDLLGLYGAKT